MSGYVLLLRAPDEDGRDRYEVVFEASGYVPLLVPVLETALHVDALRAKIARGPDGLSAVILTSKRAVEAWCEALPDTPADWRTIPFYVVGDATARAAERLRVGQVCGGQTGTAERLAEFILGERVGGRMLYLTGDKNRETLPTMLAAGGIALDTLEVYHTIASSTFRADLEAAMARAPVGRGVWGWVVHFAPSAAAAVAGVLGEVFGDKVKVAAIGPTTASLLGRVDVVAPKPTPDALCTAIVGYDGTN